MTMPPSDTFFSHAPQWEWWIILYFFFGGIAAGCFVFSAILDLFGRPSDRKLANLGYLIAFPALVVCPLLLIIDLDRPDRFLNMLFMSNHMPTPILKTYSPMSIGAWALAVFGIFVTIAFFSALAEERSIGGLGFLRGSGLRKANAAIGAFPGFFVAGYTGVLLSVTNRPIWADTPMLGGLFLLSAASTAAALMVWIGWRRASESSVSWLAGVEKWIAVLEIIAIVVTVVTLGPVARAFAGGWGLLLAAVVLFGLVVPLVLHYRPNLLGTSNVAVASALVLAGGFLLRVVVILSSEAI